MDDFLKGLDEDEDFYAAIKAISDEGNGEWDISYSKEEHDARYRIAEEMADNNFYKLIMVFGKRCRR